MNKMARYLDYLLEKWNNPKGKVVLKETLPEENQSEEESIMIDYGDEGDSMSTKRNFVMENKEYLFILLF